MVWASPAVGEEGKPSIRNERQSCVLSSTDTSLEPEFATATSGKVSPLKSPTATDTQDVPAAEFGTDRKVPSPLPSSTLTSLPLTFAVTRSGLASALKSANATE